MQVHDLTLMLSLFFASITGAIVLSAITRMSQTIEGTRYWAIALGILSIAYLSQLSMQGMPRYVMVITFNTCLILGHAFWLIGAWHFVHKPPSKQKIFLLIVPILALSLVFTLLIPDRSLRLLGIGVWLLLVRANYAWVLWQHAKHDRNEYIAVTITVSVVLLELILSFFYTLYGAFGALPSIGERFSWVGGYTWVVALIGIVAGVPLLMLLSVGRFVRKLEYAAHHDELTDLLNRRGLSKCLDSIMPLSQRKCRSLSVIMLDVDHFKYINDEFGHKTGDQILAHVGKKLKSSVRASDLVTRWGGEEFCIVLFDTSPAHAMQLAEKVRAAFSESLEQLNPTLNNVTLSAGIANTETVSKAAFEATQLQADKALYQAKNNGRDRSEMYLIEDV
ncbi:GGDEF domain-containing protein [Pseudoalteromonas luteoviolacea]|uniref:diguanylate cyclase n=1 Tax=Pseudoalteromonas luteoviolacea S4054 TaxID=1129367 RepID=A0A0F6AB72_9GAMM|nr:GGDEF domain-containing protein [Pseudoalteromonas luteoviolacea]AOT08586.1 hypothetical protein S4054249_12315 [Pseudoalteromonas luteoviolacea]AOT13502.1 hypothetical protein S40542_12290 [Pseudoalteromonas luteoviolacea]AOT18415.1 hypothetical protein S4054_12290 [Pseudoalteromonas luteoviolacea]KKE83415.1 hypothetical protein N479_13675 [Pseudoalteromonas luteoviolacea S4054]KZN75852.1 hypothetical protein N481_05770 [Pseudoalteromonas luteoviolacea S4047-1]